jgi:hypothetical protein
MRGVGSFKLSNAPTGVGKMASSKYGVGKMKPDADQEAKKAGVKANEGLEKLLASKGKK